MVRRRNSISPVLIEGLILDQIIPVATKKLVANSRIEPFGPRIRNFWSATDAKIQAMHDVA